MVGKEDASGNPLAGNQNSGSRKMYWRSASWSASRTASRGPGIVGKDIADLHGDREGQNRCFPPPLLTPRSQQHCKARSCLPPLQPLSIGRRSLEEWPKAGSDDIGVWQQPPTPSGRKSSERLKLDLSSIHQDLDENCGMVERDKFAHFDKECSKVAEHVYLGGDVVARDREILKKNGITHVLNCAGFLCSEYFKNDFVYRTLWLQDDPSEDITSILYDVFDYFEDVRYQHGRVFVHCLQGVSRSTSVVIAYLMWREDRGYDDAFKRVKEARRIADPNVGFTCQLLQYQKRIHATPLSPSSLLRMYQLAPHSPYDPLHLVPKTLDDPSPSALDSRGAFIVQLPSVIYIWVGKNCEAVMERDARGAVSQIVRYEKVEGPVVMITEGEEPSYFWDAFSSFLPLMDKSGRVEVRDLAIKIAPGQRKVDAYNVDFGIFQKAIKGGFIPRFASSENECETHLPARESCWNLHRCISQKKSISRVYSESMLLVHSTSPLPLPSSSSSSSSFLSPDSVSPDSSSGSKDSESSLDSPSAASCSLPVATALSDFSSSESKSNRPEIVGKNCGSQTCPQSSPSACRKAASASLAERRGNLTKSLKLPMAKHNVRVNSSFSHVRQEDRIGMNSITACGPHFDIVFDSKQGSRKAEGDMSSKLNLSPCSVANVDQHDKLKISSISSAGAST